MSVKLRPREVVTCDLRNLQLEFSADADLHGISSLVWNEGDVELAREPFILNLYRMLATNTLMGEARARSHVVNTEFQNSAVMSMQPVIQLRWEPWEGHPVYLAATYSVGEPNMIDLVIEIEALAPISAYEVFLSSYFQPIVAPHVIIRRQRNARDDGTAVLSAITHSPFLYGHYVSFPRDTAAAALKYDGRWNHGSAPVIWATSPTYAVPMAIMAPSQANDSPNNNRNRGPVVIQMASTDTCFSVNTTYTSAEVDDIVSRHNAVYFSLFGSDLQGGERRTARLRTIVVPELPELHALLDLHWEFERENKTSSTGPK
jgi:hypothetical protein